MSTGCVCTGWAVLVLHGWELRQWYLRGTACSGTGNWIDIPSYEPNIKCCGHVDRDSSSASAPVIKESSPDVVWNVATSVLLRSVILWILGDFSTTTLRGLPSRTNDSANRLRIFRSIFPLRSSHFDRNDHTVYTYTCNDHAAHFGDE